MMRHLVLPAELPVFILERVVTMWARGHDVLRLVPGERLDIGLRQLLKKELVADATRRIACASLLFAEHREVHSRLLEQQRRRALFCARGWDDAAQPTQSKYSKAGFDSTVGTPSPSAQPKRSEFGRP